MKKFFVVLTGMVMSMQLQADVTVRQVPYEIDGQQYEGMLVTDSATSAQPALLMVPNWMGPTTQAAEKAKKVASYGYTVFVADMYGKDVRPQNEQEASDAAGKVRGDRALMRQRAQKALEVLRAQSASAKFDANKIGAIGFCFGGGTVLELARSGADVAGVVSFHGNLDTPNLDDAKNVKARTLVLHGADDPYVPKDQVDAFIKEMQDANVDWQMVMFGNAVHSFTDPTANAPGKAQYNPAVAQRAFRMMDNFYKEIFDAR